MIHLSEKNSARGNNKDEEQGKTMLQISLFPNGPLKQRENKLKF